MFVLELRVLPVLRRSPEGSGAPMDFADADSVLNPIWKERAWANSAIAYFRNPPWQTIR